MEFKIQTFQVWKVMPNQPNDCCIFDPCTWFQPLYTLSLTTVRLDFRRGLTMLSSNTIKLQLLEIFVKSYWQLCGSVLRFWWVTLIVIDINNPGKSRKMLSYYDASYQGQMFQLLRALKDLLRLSRNSDKEEYWQTSEMELIQ